ncbi:hypothetical protein GCM10007858_01900 [Bradyrhizobium liaoningense]|nr:hypothetical protein GCM10007858_01900 [Bradyrhizobium liaoningense]
MVSESGEIPVEHADQAGNKACIEDVGDNGEQALLTRSPL